LIEPDVLILDEVIAVGDEGFRSKCYQVIGDLLARCAVVFVSHSMPMIYRLSTGVLALSNGEPVFLGDPARGIEHYLESLASDQVVPRSLGTGDATIHRFAVLDEHCRPTKECHHSRPYRLSMDLTVSSAFPEYDVEISFMSRAQEAVAQCHSAATGLRCTHTGAPHCVEIAFDAQVLNPGRYWINVAIFDRSATRHLCWEVAIGSFTVVGRFVGNAPVQLVGTWQTTPIAASEQPQTDPNCEHPKALS
jgi:lipopolysaccharide transport system ATP-binding protein